MKASFQRNVVLCPFKSTCKKVTEERRRIKKTQSLQERGEKKAQAPAVKDLPWNVR
jgi:hypothetical protein